MTTLGLISTGRRNIQSGLEYDHLFPSAKMQDDVVIRDGNVKDTVHLMSEVVHKYLDDTRLIAPKLKGKNLEDTCRNIWDFVFSHIQYKLDQKGLEQLRRPARSWYERVSGVDCDCYSIFISSILTNLGIPHKFRITKYEGDWQHVYVVVPKSQGGHFIMDCVVDEFNYEKPYTDKFQYNMTTLSGLPIAVLSGLDEDNELYGILSGADFAELDYLEGLGKAPTDEQELRAIYNHLVSTRDYILKNPNTVITSGGATAHLQMLNYAIDNWNTPNRDNALEVLAQEEERWNQHNGITGLEGDEDEINGLGASKAPKKFFSKIKDVVKKVGTAVKKVGQKAGEVAKKIGKAIIRFNPLSLAVRGGFLLAMKLNLLNMGGKLYPAYLSEAEAKAKGITTDKWQKAKNALAKVENLFVNKLQGKADKLKSAIVSGRATKQFHGFGEIGEPATITAVVASSVPLIETAKILKDAGASDGKDGDTGSEKGFIQSIKDWWKKAFGKETAVPAETISDADKAPNESVTTEEKTSENTKDDNGTPSEGMMSKITSFVKENPGKTAIGVAVVGTAITLAVSKKARHAVGLGATPKKRKRKKTKHNPLTLINLK